jgi:hypothetical protein
VTPSILRVMTAREIKSQILEMWVLRILLLYATITRDTTEILHINIPRYYQFFKIHTRIDVFSIIDTIDIMVSLPIWLISIIKIQVILWNLIQRL